MAAVADPALFTLLFI